MSQSGLFVLIHTGLGKNLSNSGSACVASSRSASCPLATVKVFQKLQTPALSRYHDDLTAHRRDDARGVTAEK